MAAVMMLSAAVGAGAMLILNRRAPAQASLAPGIVRITSDAGFTTEPAVAPNGALLAYVSDRAGEGLDIWVQPLLMGEPVRITRDAADYCEAGLLAGRQPNRVSIRAWRRRHLRGAVLGGAERLVAAKGRGPKFFPTAIAYATGGRALNLQLWVTDGRGGTPRQLAPELHVIDAVRCRDSSALVTTAPLSANLQAPPDWYVVGIGGAAATSLGVRAALRPPACRSARQRPGLATSSRSGNAAAIRRISGRCR